MRYLITLLLIVGCGLILIAGCSYTNWPQVNFKTHDHSDKPAQASD